MGKKKVIFALIVLLSLIIPAIVSANFACGTVFTNEDISPSWFNVILNYQQNPALTTSCKISPDGSKYCCDPTAITGVAWGPGKVLNARVFDSNEGYFSSPVQLTISGEGFDVFYDIELKNAISINLPNESLFLNAEKIPIHVSIDPYFNSISYQLFLSDELIQEEELCTECTETISNLNLPSAGEYTLKIIASNGNDEITKSFDFINLEYIEFTRTLQCNGCQPNFVPKNREVNITVSAELSHPVSGTFTDIFPSNWQYLGNESIQEYTETHNLIQWQVEGQTIQKTYTLKSPSNGPPTQYIFQSMFNTFESEEYLVLVFNFFIPDFFPRATQEASTIEIRPSELVNYVHVSPSAPLVFNIKDIEYPVYQIAIFPKESSKKIKAFMIPSEKELNSVLEFTLRSNLQVNNLDYVLIRFKLENTGENSPENLKVLNKKREWEEIKFEMYNKDEKYFYYDAYANSFGEFAIIKIRDERSFLEKIFG